MNISSVQPDYSITSSDSADTITIDLSSLSSDTITIGSGGSSLNYATYTGGISSGVYSLGPSVSIGTISIGDLTQEYQISEEWVNCFPEFSRIQEMCKQYPGLKIAYDKFVTTYKLVRDDYDTPEDQRTKP